MCGLDAPKPSSVDEQSGDRRRSSVTSSSHAKLRKASSTLTFGPGRARQASGIARGAAKLFNSNQTTSPGVATLRLVNMDNDRRMLASADLPELNKTDRFQHLRPQTLGFSLWLDKLPKSPELVPFDDPGFAKPIVSF